MHRRLSNANISVPPGNNANLTKRVIDVVNQCKYLASKKGMTVKELRKVMREDEARQRQFVRQTEKYNNQMMQYHSAKQPEGLLTGQGSHQSWNVHVNNDGALYSQFNVEPYGGWTMDEGDCEDEGDDVRKMKKLNRSGPDKDCRSTESIMDLLYFASQSNNNDKKPSPVSSPRHKLPSKTGGASGRISAESYVNLPVNVKESESTKSLDTDSSLVDLSRLNRPVRKMGSHDLTNLKNAQDKKYNDDLSFIMMAEDFSTSDEESDGEFEFTELNEKKNSGAENDEKKKPEPRKIVSPLLKKVESAFADLQKNDSVFGTMDDFGHLMEKIL